MAYPGTATPHRARRPQRRRNLSPLAVPIALFAMVLAFGIGYVGYVLWPRWPGAAAMPKAPSLPITIGGVAFNLPPGAIRVAVQRRPGIQERVDLVFLWPSLAPPDPNAKLVPPPSPTDIDRVFLTISNSEGAMTPDDRARTIYPRYLANAVAGPEGLAVRAFREGTPYQGEDLIYDPTAAHPFQVRCTRQGAAQTPGTCLYDTRIGNAEIVLRFPRDWLSDWRNVAQLSEQLIASFRSSGG